MAPALQLPVVRETEAVARPLSPAGRQEIPLRVEAPVVRRRLSRVEQTAVPLRPAMPTLLPAERRQVAAGQNPAPLQGRRLQRTSSVPRPVRRR
jgi:hypothetical protein